MIDKTIATRHFLNSQKLPFHFCFHVPIHFSTYTNTIITTMTPIIIIISRVSPTVTPTVVPVDADDVRVADGMADELVDILLNTSTLEKVS